MPQKNNSIKKKIDTGEMGGSGTTIYRGVISDVEYNSVLNTEYGGQGLNMYDRMRKSDPVVKASLNIIKLGILQAEWYIEPASDEPSDKEVADFIEEALFKRLQRNFPEVLKEILTYLDFGFCVLEKIFKIEDNKVWWKKFSLRGQKSITKFEAEDKQEGITQQLEGDLAEGERTRKIPIEKLLIFSNDKEGDNWRGVSLLRSAFKPFFMKENLEKIDAIGFERTSLGIPVFEQPQNPKPEDVEMSKELGENIRANEKAYLSLPFGWGFKIVFPEGRGRADADTAIRRYDRAILLNTLSQFLDLGSGNTGSRSLSKDHSEVLYKSLQAIAEYIASIFNSYAIPQLVDLNMNNVTKYPKLMVTGIDRIDTEAFSGAVEKLMNAGALKADSDLEDYLRNIFRLPPRMETEEGVYEKDDKDTEENVEKNKVKDSDSEEDPEEENKELLKKGSKHFGMYDNKPFWRDLTFAEEKVNLRSLKNKMDILEQEISRELPTMLSSYLSETLNQVRTVLQIGDTNRVGDIVVGFRESVRQYTMNKLRDAFEVGKISASNELGIEAPKNSLDIINEIKVRADAIANKLATDIESSIRLVTLDLMGKKIPVEEGITALEGQINNQLASTIGGTASIVSSGGINQGRQSVFDSNPEKIYAMQRSEILDSHICGYCLSMDGRVVNKEDPLTKYGPFHFRCRGIWVSILNEEEELPSITGVPNDLREAAGTGVGDFTQIKTPKPLEGSLAEEFLNERD
jgi:phage gp29-like protein